MMIFCNFAAEFKKDNIMFDIFDSSKSSRSYKSGRASFRIKKYNPEGWKKKGGNDLFKKSGGRRNKSIWDILGNM